MATLKDIALKGAELKTAFDILESYKQDKSNAQARLAAVNDLIDAQQVIVNQLQAELKALLP